MANGSPFYSNSGQPARGNEGMPGSTPSLILDQQMTSLQARFKQREHDLKKQLKGGMYDEQGFIKEMQGMQKEFDEQYYGIEDRQNQLKTLTAMKDAGIMSGQAAGESGYALVNNSYTQNRAFPTAPTGSRTPYSPKQLKDDHIPEIKRFADDPDISDDPEKMRTQNRHWWLPRRFEGEERSQETMLAQYDKWRRYIGYDYLGAGKQSQVDNEWDKHMKTNEMFSWDPKHKGVSARRAKGRFNQAMSYRFNGSAAVPGEGGSPWDLAAGKEVDKNNPKEEVMMTEVATGRRGMVPAADVKDFLENGYTR